MQRSYPLDADKNRQEGVGLYVKQILLSDKVREKDLKAASLEMGDDFKVLQCK